MKFRRGQIYDKMTDLKIKESSDKQTSMNDFYLPSERPKRGTLTVEKEKITLSELEQYLWGAANILRGPVDKADFKSYIFPARARK